MMSDLGPWAAKVLILRIPADRVFSIRAERYLNTRSLPPAAVRAYACAPL